MEDPTLAFPDLRLLEAGTVPQVVVHFTLNQQGQRQFHGRATGRNYPFDATEPYRWVHADDIAHFRTFPFFEVLEHTRIDPAERAMEERMGQYLAARLAEFVPPDPPRKRVADARVLAMTTAACSST